MGTDIRFLRLWRKFEVLRSGVCNRYPPGLAGERVIV